MALLNVLVYGFIAGFATLIGTLLVFAGEDWSRRHSLYLVSFAAGVMLAITFVHLIPESMRLASNAVGVVLIGILLFYLAQNLLLLHPCHDEACEVHRLGLLSLFGLTFHSLLDGVAIGVGFEVSTRLGVLTTLAVLVHELPEGIATTGILLFSKMERAKVFWYSVLVALATPAGALLSILFLRNMSSNILGILLALAAGSFIYVSAADLIPQTHRQQNRVHAVLLVAGASLVALLGQLFD